MSFNVVYLNKLKNMKKVLILLRGVPGSGKTTVADVLSTFSSNGILGSFEHKYTVCTADDYFMKDGEYKWDPKFIGAAHKWCQDKCRKAMENGEYKVFVANTNTQMKEMKVYFDMAKEFGYKVFSLVVENRHGGKNEHGVPEATLKAMEERFEIKLT